MATHKQQLPKLHMPHLSLDFSNFSLFSSPSRASARSTTSSTSTNGRHTPVRTKPSPASTGRSDGLEKPATSPSPSLDHSPGQPEKPSTAYGPQHPVKSPPRPLLRISTSPHVQAPVSPSGRHPVPSPSDTPPHSALLPIEQQQQRLGLPSPGPSPLHTSASYTPPLSAFSTPEQRLQAPPPQSPTPTRCSHSDSTSNRSSHVLSPRSSTTSIATTLSHPPSTRKPLASPPLDPLPPNTSPVPVLHPTAHTNSKYAPAYRHLVSKLGFILHDARLERPLFGLFRAGDNPDMRRNPEVLAILLEPADLEGERWRAVEELVRMLGVAYWREVGVPNIRFWQKREGACRPGGGRREEGRESWMGRQVGGGEGSGEGGSEGGGGGWREGEGRDGRVPVGVFRSVGRAVVVDIAKTPVRSLVGGGVGSEEGLRMPGSEGGVVVMLEAGVGVPV